MHVDFPYHLDERLRTASSADGAYIRDLIEQVLFTSPGERVNRPSFGSGLLQLVFAPNSDALAGATQMTVQAALQQWLSEFIRVEAVDVQNNDSRLEVRVQYVVLRSQQREVAEFSRSV